MTLDKYSKDDMKSALRCAETFKRFISQLSQQEKADYADLIWVLKIISGE